MAYTQLLHDFAAQRGVNIALRKLESTQQAQQAPTPSTTYAMFYNGEFVTNEIFSEKKMAGFFDQQGL